MKTLLSLCALAMLVGCGTTPKAYVEADEKTFNAIEPAYREYVEADESLSETSKALRLAVLDSWRARLQAAKEAK